MNIFERGMFYIGAFAIGYAAWGLMPLLLMLSDHSTEFIGQFKIFGGLLTLSTYAATKF